MKKSAAIKENQKPWGAFIFSWIHGGRSSTKVIYFLVIVCVSLLVIDFFYERYGHFSIEKLPGFYAFYGFGMFSLIIFLATVLRYLLGRKEDFYGTKAIDSEEKYDKDSEELK